METIANRNLVRDNVPTNPMGTHNRLVWKLIHIMGGVVIAPLVLSEIYYILRTLNRTFLTVPAPKDGKVSIFHRQLWFFTKPDIKEDINMRPEIAIGLFQAIILVLILFAIIRH